MLKTESSLVLALDLGTGGCILLPDQQGLHSHLLITAGKLGTIYLVDRDNLGHFKANSDSQIVQSITKAFSGWVHSSPSFWQGASGSWVYLGAVRDSLKAFSLSNGVLSKSPTSHSQNTFSYPGPTPVVSSNGELNGIVWALSKGSKGEAILNAYDATNLAQLLYSSDQAPLDRDRAEQLVKFSVPVVANGNVYFGTQDHLDVYGLRH